MPKDTFITVDEIWDVLDSEDNQRQKLPGEITVQDYANKRGIVKSTAHRRLEAMVTSGKLVKRWGNNSRTYFYSVPKVKS